MQLGCRRVRKRPVRDEHEPLIAVPTEPGILHRRDAEIEWIENDDHVRGIEPVEGARLDESDAPATVIAADEAYVQPPAVTDTRERTPLDRLRAKAVLARRPDRVDPRSFPERPDAQLVSASGLRAAHAVHDIQVTPVTERPRRAGPAARPGTRRRHDGSAAVGVEERHACGA